MKTRKTPLMADRLISIVFVITLFAFCATKANAQKNFMLGINSSTTFTQPHLSGTGKGYPAKLDAPMKPGYIIGVESHFGMTDQIAFRIGMNLIMKNYTTQLSTPWGTVQENFNTVSAQIPFKLTSVSRIAFKDFYLRQSLGFVLTVLDQGKGTEYLHGNSPADYTIRRITRLDHTFNYGLLVSIGIEHDFRKAGVLGLGVSYHIAYKPELTKRLDYEVNGYEFTANTISKGSYVSINLSYYFNNPQYVPRYSYYRSMKR